MSWPLDPGGRSRRENYLTMGEEAHPLKVEDVVRQFTSRFRVSWMVAVFVLVVSHPHPAKAQAYVYSSTIGTAGKNGPGGTELDSPTRTAVDVADGRLFIADTGNDRIQIYDTTTLAHIATIGGTAASESPGTIHLSKPAGVAFDAANGHILVADTGNSRVQIFDARSLLLLGTIGVAGEPGNDDAHLNSPQSVKINPVAGQIYVADSENDRVQIFDARSRGYVATLRTDAIGSHLSFPTDAEYNPLTNQIMVADTKNFRVEFYDAITFRPRFTLGTTGVTGDDNDHFSDPVSVTFDSVNKIFLVVDAFPNNRVQLFNATTSRFLSTLGQTAAGVISSNLMFSPGGVSADPAHSRIFISDPDNQRVQVYAAVPYVIALAATAQNDGILHVPLGGQGAFAVASTNIGATDNVIATVDTGDATLPLTAAVCQTGAGGRCLAAPNSSVSLSFPAGATPTFSVFVNVTGAIPLSPDTSSIFLRFLDGNGVSRGVISVAIETM